MGRKAQSAMEFLMTYGWAILIMLVVVGVLFMLGVFNPQTASPNSCILPAGFSCYGYAIRDAGVLVIDIGQATGSDVQITNMACTAQDNPTVPALSAPIVIQSGKHVQVPGTEALTCYNEDGATTPSEGDFYRGTLHIYYTDQRTSITHKIKGDISYKVEAS